MLTINPDDYQAYQACIHMKDAYQRRISIYSSNTYTTMDVDFISNSEIASKEILLQLGYVKIGKDYYHEALESLMEFPSRDYNEDSNRFVEYTDPHTNLPLFMVGIEDLILDRIGSYDATNDLSSKEWSLRLMLSYYDHIDWSYLHAISHKRNFFDKTERIQQQVKSIRRNSESGKDSR